MERVFAITSSSKTVTLDPQGRGRVTFTVTNTGFEPLTARCRVVSAEPAAEGWFEPLERPERRLEPEGTEQLTVNLAVPAGAAAGGYSFRLDATSVENPDEHHVEGQSVAFEVAPTAPEKKSGFPWWILIVAGVLVAGLLAWWLWPSGAPGLGESCENECADGLVCNEAKVCVGELGFAGCADGGDCAAGLDCYEVEEGGEQVSLCLGALGFTGCGEANDCGESLVCDEATCRGGLDFACSGTSDCASDFWCRDKTCSAAELCSTFDDGAEGWRSWESIVPFSLEVFGNEPSWKAEKCIELSDQKGGYYYHFLSPDSWKGDWGRLYGKTLSYWLKVARSPDTDAKVYNMPDVRIKGSRGYLEYFFDSSHFPTTHGNKRSIQLLPLPNQKLKRNGRELGWWKPDGSPADEKYFGEILKSATALLIRGEYSTGHDWAWLDEVCIR